MRNRRYPANFLGRERVLLVSLALVGLLLISCVNTDSGQGNSTSWSVATTTSENGKGSAEEGPTSASYQKDGALMCQIFDPEAPIASQDSPIYSVVVTPDSTTEVMRAAAVAKGTPAADCLQDDEFSNWVSYGASWMAGPAQTPTPGPTRQPSPTDNLF